MSIFKTFFITFYLTRKFNYVYIKESVDSFNKCFISLINHHAHIYAIRRCARIRKSVVIYKFIFLLFTEYILRRSASVTITSLRWFDDDIGGGGGTPGRSCSDKLVDRFELVMLEDNSPLLLRSIGWDSIIANNYIFTIRRITKI